MRSLPVRSVAAATLPPRRSASAPRALTAIPLLSGVTESSRGLRHALLAANPIPAQITPADWSNPDLLIRGGMILGVAVLIGFHRQLIMEPTLRYNVRNILKTGYELGEEQSQPIVQQFAQAYREFGHMSHLIRLLVQYKGPIHALEESMQQKRQVLRQAAAHQITEDVLAEKWAALKQDGWQMTFVKPRHNGHLPFIVYFEEKRLQISHALFAEDPRLIFFRALTQIELLHECVTNSDTISQNTRRMIIDSSWNYHYAQLPDTDDVPPFLVDLVVTYLIKQEVVMRAMQYYTDLAAADPGVKTASLEDIVWKPSDAQRLIAERYIPYDSLPYGLVKELWQHRLDEILA